MIDPGIRLGQLLRQVGQEVFVAGVFTGVVTSGRDIRPCRKRNGSAETEGPLKNPREGKVESPGDIVGTKKQN
jgi:hypothetical protein